MRVNALVMSVTGPRIDEDCIVSTYSTLQSTSILGAYDWSSSGEPPGSVLAQATCSLTARGYPRKTLQVLPRANTAKF